MSFAQWDKLLFGIERGDCILFLGPGLPAVASDGERQFPVQALADRLSRSLDIGPSRAAETSLADLAWIAQRFLAQEDDVGLEMQVGQWQREWTNRPSTLHDDLAALPFRYIVTSGLDPLMQNALERAGKRPAVERYHYRGRNPDMLPEPSIERPVLYHLHGVASEFSSVVLTELQLLDFLARLIARDPPLPNDLNAALTHGRLFLFLGFGLRQWYLRILFHVLKVLRSDSRGFAIDALGDEANRAPGDRDPAILFYRDNFKMDLSTDDPTHFAHELRTRWDASGGPERIAPAKRVSVGVPVETPFASAPKVFICHASEDREMAARVHAALKSSRLEPWLDKDALRGGDRWNDMIEHTIDNVNFVVVLNSKSLAAKSREASYVNKEIKRALQADEMRLSASFIVPAILDDTPLLQVLNRYQAVDLRSENGLNELVRAIKRQAQPT